MRSLLALMQWYSFFHGSADVGKFTAITDEASKRGALCSYRSRALRQTNAATNLLPSLLVESFGCLRLSLSLWMRLCIVQCKTLEKQLESQQNRRGMCKRGDWTGEHHHGWITMYLTGDSMSNSSSWGDDYNTTIDWDWLLQWYGKGLLSPVSSFWWRQNTSCVHTAVGSIESNTYEVVSRLLGGLVPFYCLSFQYIKIAIFIVYRSGEAW